MRLLNTKTLELVEMVDESVVPYAILSHRWENDEVSFRDMTDRGLAEHKAGFQKVRGCCWLAAKQGLEFAWVDTCCIDKSSSAELQEAINSMFRWYEKAAVCYVYLSDIDAGAQYCLEDSQWFTRGWTLQELIAPSRLEFYDCHWNFIQNRRDIAETLSDVTRVPEALLRSVSHERSEDLSNYNIAQRMSWANGRRTTRVEDRAYSLLGLFNVNMPMLYGEGKQAFVRLQEEIIKRSNDQSILIWIGLRPQVCELLAQSPDNFPHLGIDTRSSNNQAIRRRAPSSMTNEGLNIELELTPWRPRVYLALLSHTEEDDGTRCYTGIFLKKISDENIFARVADQSPCECIEGRHSSVVNTCPNSMANEVFYGSLVPRAVRQIARPKQMMKVTIVHSLVTATEYIHLSKNPSASLDIDVGNNGHLGNKGQWRGEPWVQSFTFNDKYQTLCYTHRGGQFGPVAYYTADHGLVEAALIGFDFDFDPVVIFCLRLGTHPSDAQFKRNDFIAGQLDWAPCTQGLDWLPIGSRPKLVSRPNNSTFWPFKMKTHRGFDVAVTIFLHGSIDGLSSPTVNFVLKRHGEGGYGWSFAMDENAVCPSPHVQLPAYKWNPARSTMGIGVVQ